MAVALALVMILALLAGLGAVFIWQQQNTALLRQEALVQRERAVAEAARARAVAEQQLARATQPDRAVPEQPGSIGDNLASIEAPIRTVLQSQQRAWNAGDIDQFMEYYWKSDDLTFRSGGKLTRTWQGTLENYKERYHSPSEMGKLSFRKLEVTPLGMKAALVVGEWQLSRESDQLRKVTCPATRINELRSLFSCL